MPIARGFASVQLNLLIRLGSLAVATLALVIVHGVSVPTGPPALAGGYVVIIGIGAFLEKAALRRLDATQLNGLMATAITAVALVAFAVEGPRMPMSRRRNNSPRCWAGLSPYRPSRKLGSGALP